MRPRHTPRNQLLIFLRSIVFLLPSPGRGAFDQRQPLALYERDASKVAFGRPHMGIACIYSYQSHRKGVHSATPFIFDAASRRKPLVKFKAVSLRPGESWCG